LTCNNFIGAGEANCICIGSCYNVIGGGLNNSLGGTADSCANTIFSVIGGGKNNQIDANGRCSFIGGGVNNCICVWSDLNFLGGGSLNRISGESTVLVGGFSNRAEGLGTIIVGVIIMYQVVMVQLLLGENSMLLQRTLALLAEEE
jgi:hypothetical protein